MGNETRLPRLAVLMTPELHDSLVRLAHKEHVPFNRAVVAQLTSALAMLSRDQLTVDAIKDAAGLGAGKRACKVDVCLRPSVRQAVFDAADRLGMPRSAFVYGVLQHMQRVLAGGMDELDALISRRTAAAPAAPT